jgi:hypothetical protein
MKKNDKVSGFQKKELSRFKTALFFENLLFKLN